jgi:hypothetical protein
MVGVPVECQRGLVAHHRVTRKSASKSFGEIHQAMQLGIADAGVARKNRALCGPAKSQFPFQQGLAYDSNDR